MLNKIEEAKDLLRREGYVVIPKERHRVLTVQKAVSRTLVATMQPEEVRHFEKHCARTAAAMMGEEMLQQGAIYQSAPRYDAHMNGYVVRYEAGVILPR